MKRQNVLNKKKKKKGFTLIELIIVIAIIAILAVIAIPRFGQVRRQANINADIANAKTIANAVSMALADGEINPAANNINTATPLNVAGNNDIDEIVSRLDSIPEGRATAEQFSVAMTNTGDLTITLGAEQVYPNPPAGLYHQ